MNYAYLMRSFSMEVHFRAHLFYPSGRDYAGLFDESPAL